MNTNTLYNICLWESWLKAEEKGTTEDKMVGWHHWFDGHEFEQALGDCEGQESLMDCSPWGHKESDMTKHAHKATTIYKIDNQPIKKKSLKKYIYACIT